MGQEYNHNWYFFFGKQFNKNLKIQNSSTYPNSLYSFNVVLILSIKLQQYPTVIIVKIKLA